MFRHLPVFVLALVLSVPAAASEFPVTVAEKRLENGMKVFCLKRPGSPQASCMLAVRTGASAERAGYTGIAHFLEHMLFKGTDKIGVIDAEKDRELRGRIDAVMAKMSALEDEGVPEDQLAPLREERDRLFTEQRENLVLNHVFKIYSDAGGSMTNAFTSDDMTAYFSILPAHKIELFFWIEAERFRNPVFRQFHSEKNVVREERRLSENRPGHAAQEEFRRVLFGSHPYAHPVIGYHEDLVRLSRADMRTFFDTWYKPDNMFLMVSGDVEPEHVFRLAERYFGDWKPFAGRRPRIPTVPPAKSGPARVYSNGAGSESLTLAYRLPPSGTTGDVDADLLAMHLGDEEGALRKGLVEERGIATSVRVRVESKRFGSVFWISVEMKEGHSPEEAEADVLAAVQALVDAPLSDETMATLRRRYRARILGMVKNDRMLAFRFMRHEIFGSWRNIGRNLTYSRTIAAESLQAMAAEYLTATNRVVGIYESAPRPATKPAARPAEPVAKAAPPANTGRPESWKDLEFPRRPLAVPSAADHVTKLENGIRLVMVPDADDPAFRIQAIVAGGSAEDPAGKEGLATVLAGALGQAGYGDLTREEVRRKLEEIVGTYSVSDDRFSLRFSLDTFPTDRFKAVALFRDLLLTSKLEASIVKTEKERRKAAIADSDVQPGAVSRRTFRELLLGADVRTRRPSAGTLDAIEPADLAAALERFRDPRRIILVLSGPFDPSAMTAALEQAFDGLKPGKGSVPEIPTELAAAPKTGLNVMDFDSSQGYVLIGARTVPATDERYAAVWTLRTVLSRRIFNRIRSNEGLAYQASARLGKDWDVPSLFSVVFQTKNRSAAYGMALALEEIERIATEGPDADELATALESHRAGLERSLGRSSSRATAFGDLVLHAGAGLDWYPRNRAAMRRITPEAVRAAAAEFLAREKLAIVCVGRRAEMADGDGEHPQTLAGFGPIAELAPPAAPEPEPTPKSVTLSLIRRMGAGDLDGVKALTAGKLRERLDAPEAAQQMAMQGRFLSNADCEVAETAEEGDEATVNVNLAAKRGEREMKMTMVFSLTRADGEWKVVGMRPKGR